MACGSIVLMAGGASASVVGPVVANGTRIAGAVPPHLHATRGVTATGSTNWSGYAQVSTTRGTFTQVIDTFVVPTIVPSGKGTQYVADWVGIGGYDDGTLVQDGIQAVIHTRRQHSTVTYDAWTEHLPQAEKPLDLTVSAGDTVTAFVQETAKNMWLMEVEDVTTGLSASTSVKYASSGLSAEAIMERPCIRAPCATRDLAHLAAQSSAEMFGPGSYSGEIVPAGQTPTEEPLLATVPGLTLADIVMTNNTETTPIATPSGPSSEEDGFAVADGADPPLPPNV
jgi:hypothetical protein